MPSNKLSDPNFNPTTNPHERYRAGQVAVARKSEAEAEQRNQVRVQEAPKRVYSSSGNLLDPTTANLKAEIDAERRAKKNPTPVQAAPQVSEEDAKETALELVEVFERRHPETFFSEFNARQLIYLHLHRVSQGLRNWTLSSLEKTHQELVRGTREGYGYEPRTRTRGENAKRPVPRWEPPQPSPEVISQAEALQRSRTEISAEENARLRNMPLSDLKKQVRSEWKEDPSNKVTRI